MPAQKPKKSVQSQLKPAEKRVAKTVAHSPAAKTVDKSTAKTPTKPNSKVQAVPATKMEDVAKGQAEVREGRVDREQDEAAHLASVS